tara:strand:- start:92 stop:253 length:162 start_codon:yes stop_codon:yes gene_type:complete
LEELSDTIVKVAPPPAFEDAPAKPGMFAPHLVTGVGQGRALLLDSRICQVVQG